MNSSSWLLPFRIGTRANRPAARAVPIDSVRTLPSTTPGMANGREVAHQRVDGQVAQALRGLVGAADAGCEGLTEGLGVGQ